GEFSYPTDVAIAADGGFYVADGYNDRVQKFTAEGAFLTAFGTPAEGPGHSEMAVAADGSVWTTHFAGHRVEKWRPEQKPGIGMRLRSAGRFSKGWMGADGYDGLAADGAGL
ncbi:MAG: hypothetical protein RQ826_16625, partial [Xanthomonadales bacterium]|nr:hypothetical protein [Xanthomonadales bacterium]